MRRQGKKLAQVARVQARGQLYLPDSEDQRESDAEFDEALAAFGLVAEPATLPGEESGQEPQAKCCLWPCNLPTFNLWQRVQTQWMFDASGARRGLNYDCVIRFMADVLLIKPKSRDEMFRGIQAMEAAALDVWDQRG